jgi:hypothetical protein
MTKKFVFDKVVCDDSNNTPEDIDNGVVNVDIYGTVISFHDKIDIECVKDKPPSHCCPNCGEQIGWLGRFFNFFIPNYHRCVK